MKKTLRLLAAIPLISPLSACDGKFSNLPSDADMMAHIASETPEGLVLRVPDVNNAFLVKKHGEKLSLVVFDKEDQPTTTPALKVKRNIKFSQCNDVVRRDIFYTIEQLHGEFSVCVIDGMNGALYQLNNEDVRWIVFNTTKKSEHHHLSVEDITLDQLVYRTSK
jgi:hypothetical protein|tara:strand:- start:305020 stop:305514 length:495 start_codon:yes stop_codon:yes gene_type:complete